MTSLADLEAAVATARNAIVAFSGGVDSSLVAAVAARVLGDATIAITAVSPSLATGELDGARSVAAAVGIAHRSITTEELSRPGYRRNRPDRCYHCKTELYDRLAAIAEDEGYSAVLSGANVDDLGDWRPGLRAASEHDVRHPLVEADFRKADVREHAAALGIPSADKPAMPCLASRIPHGTEVDPDVLMQIDRAEHALRALGYRELRVRHLGPLGKVELGERDLAVAEAHKDAVIDAVLSAGYDEAELDPEPLRSGSFVTVRNIPLSVR